MQVTLLKSKIHRAAVTGASQNYEGSLTIARDLAETVGLREYERILVGNIDNGNRFETYAIFGHSGSGVFELNGGCALLGEVGDRITIMSFATMTEAEAEHHVPQTILLTADNEIAEQATI